MVQPKRLQINCIVDQPWKSLLLWISTFSSQKWKQKQFVFLLVLINFNWFGAKQFFWSFLIYSSVNLIHALFMASIWFFFRVALTLLFQKEIQLAGLYFLIKVNEKFSKIKHWVTSMVKPSIQIQISWVQIPYVLIENSKIHAVIV